MYILLPGDHGYKNAECGSAETSNSVIIYLDASEDNAYLERILQVLKSFVRETVKTFKSRTMATTNLN